MTLLVACGPGSPPADTDSGTGTDPAPTSTASSGGPPTTAPDLPSPETTDTSATEGTTTTGVVTTGVVTTGDPGIETDGDTGIETDSATGEPQGGPEPGVPLDQFGCGDAVRWLFIDPEPGGASWADIDSRGHLRVSTNKSEFRDFDASGVLVEQFSLPSQWHRGGFDAAAELYLPFIDTNVPFEQRHRWLRKFALDGTMLWEVDRGLSHGLTSVAGRAAVAPDGTTLLSQRDLGRVQRFAADGALLSDQELFDKPFHEALAMNGAGVAAAVRYEEDGAVLALAPDTSVLWEHPFAFPDRAVVDIDEMGRVTAAPVDGPLEVLRLGADGSVSWHLQPGTLPPFESVTQAAMAANELGETAVSGTGFTGDSQAAFVVKFSPAGELAAVHVCDITSAARGVAIDAAGVVYLAGAVWDEEGAHLLAAAIE